MQPLRLGRLGVKNYLRRALRVEQAFHFSRLTASELAAAGSFSQLGQDLVAILLLPSGQTYVEIGAFDGVTGSNTKLLEDRGWTGVAVEPNASAFELLKNNRTCKCLPYAVGCEDRDDIAYREVEGYPAMLSGLPSHQQRRHQSRILTEISRYGGSTREYHVQQRSIETIFSESGISECDYMSIDVEGSEAQVAMSLAKQLIRPKLLSVENNYGTSEVELILQKIGYTKVFTLAWDDFYVHDSYDLLTKFRSS